MSTDELGKRSGRWLNDADILLREGRVESAVYLCGSAVEFALKASICKALGWTAFRDDLPGMRSHNFANLLSFTSLENQKAQFQLWDIVNEWNSEIRYDSESKFTLERGKDMIGAAGLILKYLL